MIMQIVAFFDAESLDQIGKILSQLRANRKDEACAMLADPEAITAEQVLRLRQRADDIHVIREAESIRNLAFIAEIAWRACHPAEVENDETVRRLQAAFWARRLRHEAELIAVKNLAAAARRLGQRANMKMRRSEIIGAIEKGLMGLAKGDRDA